jgi:hypothetical protein
VNSRHQKEDESPTADDLLYRDVDMDEFPANAALIVDFGFDRCTSKTERSNLLGIYQDLRMLCVSSKDVHQWRVEGSLVENIRRSFEDNVPRNKNRGEYYAWFSNNQHIVCAY